MHLKGVDNLCLVGVWEVRYELDAVPLGVEEVGEHGSLWQWCVGQLHQAVHIGLADEGENG